MHHPEPQTKGPEYEAYLVEGVYHRSRSVQNELYDYCADYYRDRFRAVIRRQPRHVVEDILQQSFIIMWELIERHKLYAHNNRVYGPNDKPLSCTLRSYFLDIVKIKFKEWLSEHPSYADDMTELERELRKHGFDEKEYMKRVYGDAEDARRNIVQDMVSKMATRCGEILSMFYYERMPLDRILDELPSMESKNALKSKKYKCVQALRESVLATYRRYRRYL